MSYGFKIIVEGEYAQRLWRVHKISPKPSHEPQPVVETSGRDGTPPYPLHAALALPAPRESAKAQGLHMRPVHREPGHMPEAPLHEMLRHDGPYRRMVAYDARYAELRMAYHEVDERHAGLHHPPRIREGLRLARAQNRQNAVTGPPARQRRTVFERYVPAMVAGKPRYAGKASPRCVAKLQQDMSRVHARKYITS